MSGHASREKNRVPDARKATFEVFIGIGLYVVTVTECGTRSIGCLSERRGHPRMVADQSECNAGLPKVTMGKGLLGQSQKNGESMAVSACCGSQTRAPVAGQWPAGGAADGDGRRVAAETAALRSAAMIYKACILKTLALCSFTG